MERCTGLPCCLLLRDPPFSAAWRSGSGANFFLGHVTTSMCGSRSQIKRNYLGRFSVGTARLSGFPRLLARPKPSSHGDDGAPYAAHKRSQHTGKSSTNAPAALLVRRTEVLAPASAGLLLLLHH